jgi:hypothetical protein
MARARSFGLRPAVRTWHRLAVLALCAMLLAAQQQLRAHALSHLGDEHTTASVAQHASHDHGFEHEASACALCLAGAAAAHLMPAAPGAAPGPARPWFAPAATAAPAEHRPTVAARFARGPPLLAQIG